MNKFEENCRAKKAADLVQQVDVLCLNSGINSQKEADTVGNMLVGWGAENWASLAVCAGVRPPSKLTQDRVIARFFSRAAIVDEYSDVDPFAGFGNVRRGFGDV